MRKNADNRLDDELAGLLARRESQSQLRRLTTVPAGAADFSSNGYLSLSSHPAVQREFLTRMQSRLAGTHAAALLGSGGSRLLDGNSALAESLERSIADFHGAPAGLLFNSAMDANVGLFGCVPQPGDAIVYDELIHASVHDGMRLSRARRRIPFAHNRVWAAAESKEPSEATRSLEAALRTLQAGPDGRPVKDGERNVFVAVEGVYSMDGDLAPLTDIVACVEHCLPRGNGYIIVDEAHSTGIFGPRGSGLVCELGLEGRIWARVHGFGKAMGCSGGIVLCSPTARSYLINYARTLIYTTFMAFYSLEGIEVTYSFLRSGQAEPLFSQLKDLICLAHTALVSICVRHKPPTTLLRLSTKKPKSPIIPLFTSHPRKLAQHCQKRGYMIRPIVAPTVAVGLERVRICLHAGNTVGEVEGLVRAVEVWLLQWKLDKGDAWQESSGSAEAGPTKARL